MSVADQGQLPTWHRRRDAIAAEVSRQAGRRMSDRTLRRLSRATTYGIPALGEAMDKGIISIAAAAELALLPSELQARCIADPTLRKRVLSMMRKTP
jgi:hypothetical protein